MYENIHPSWYPLFSEYDFDLDEIYNPNLIVYPPRNLVFRVFEMDVQDISIVLLGQDPYHGPNQAHGLSFSVPTGEKIPPSLQNIFKELLLEFPERNYLFNNGNLERWFYEEKIFLLNSSLTVQKSTAGSDLKIWEDFTNKVIEFISEHNDKCVFLLLGNYAKAKNIFIKNKNKIVTEVHPSPLARGFIGSNVFKRVETILGHKINWST